MSFYDYGQTVGDGALGGFLKGGQEGFTFSQGVKSMLQKRKLDAQKAGDEHTQAGITAATDLKSAGLQAAGPQAPTTGGGPVSPLDDPSNQSRSDGAMEVGGTTPLSTGISNPKPQPGLWGRVGHALSGALHMQSGQNAGGHTTDIHTDQPQYVDRAGDAGLQLAERDTKRAQDGENSRLATTEAATNARQGELLGFQGWNDEANRANALELERMRAKSTLQWHSLAHGDAQQEKQLAVLQRQLGNLNSVQHGFMGGMAQAKDSPEWVQTEHQKAAIRRQMEVLLGMPAMKLEGYDGDMPQAPGQQAPQGGGDMYEGFDPSLFGGPNGLPPVTDQSYKQYLISIGKGPRR